MSAPGESRQTSAEAVRRFCAGFRMTAHRGGATRRRGRRPKPFREGNRDEGMCAVTQVLSYVCLERLHNLKMTPRTLSRGDFTFCAACDFNDLRVAKIA